MKNLPSATLAAFATKLSHADIPGEVMARAEDLSVDWIGSALAGKFAEPVQTIAAFARRMGPADGPSEVLMDRTSNVTLFRSACQRSGLARGGAGRRA